MKEKKFIFYSIFLIIVLLFVTACSGLRKSDDRVSEQLLAHTGTQGLTLSFSTSAPPTKIFASEEGGNITFPVIINLANQGAYDIKGGYLALSLEKNYLKMDLWDVEDKGFQIGTEGERILFNLEGKKTGRVIGESASATAFVQSLPLDRMTEQHKTSVIATACYDYETQASGQICIDMDPYNLKAIEKTCVSNTLSFSGGQGAPIEITKIEQSSLMESGGTIKPTFIIHVKNSGRGIPIISGKADEACSSEPLTTDDVNVISVSDVRFSEYSLKKWGIKCSPEFLKLKNNEGYFKCSLEEGITSGSSSFSTALYIELSYAYSETISREILLERMLFH